MTHRNWLVYTILVVVLPQLTALVLERKRLPGIWKLIIADRQVQDTLGLYYAGSAKDDEQEDILLKLNSDGSFRQCNEGYVEGRWMRGCWKCVDNQELLLAMDRQYYGKPRDTLLAGKQLQHLDEKDIPTQMIIQGQIHTGKFMYPKNHPAFFDSPVLMQQQTVGTFRLHQVLSSFALNDGEQEENEETSLPYGSNSDSAQVFTAQDLYGKHFFMTIVPVGQGKLENQPADIRAMPVQFYQNNTFSCRGVNKILRGRFVVQKSNKLLFEVSLFGAGRSAPGSVYSEGIGLSHEDKRNYIGTILTEQSSSSGQSSNNDINNSNSTLRIEGSVTFGSDLGSDARPEPVGKFILKEITPAAEDEEEVMKKEDDDFLEDDLFSQAFQ